MTADSSVQDEPQREPFWKGPCIAAVLAGVIASPLLVGLEPVGGDPDHLYRPIKFALADALRRGTLPHWNEQFGTGVPLVAESHAGAYYPLNWILYGLLDVAVAYRLAMWLHLVGCAVATAAYAHRCGARTWGAVLSGVAFTFCGFQAIHASHEVFYHSLAYLPLCLLLCQAYMDSGRLRWMILLALAFGVQLTLGHFQLAFWTASLVLLLGAWRVVVDRARWQRLAGTAAAVAWGGAIAAVQLWPSWELAMFVGQTGRSVAARSFYSFPVPHLAELALPRLFRGIAGGPMADYWWSQQTTGYEAALFVGTVPLLLAFLGALRMNRALRPWTVAIAGSLLLATMPQWWPDGYALILRIPGFGLFRAPARYTVVTSLGLALLAGRGLDHSLPIARFRSGLIAAVACGVLAFLWAAWWTGRSQFAAAFSAEAPVLRFGVPIAAWLIAIATVVTWRRGRCLPGVVVAVAGIELAALYYSTAVEWGWHLPIRSSSVIAHLREDAALRVNGDLQNLPVYAGAATANPYLGYRVPPPSDVLVTDHNREFHWDEAYTRWSRRLGVTHEVWSRDVPVPHGSTVVRLPDQILDRISGRTPEEHGTPWTIIRLPESFPSIRIVTQEHAFFDAWSLHRRLSVADEADVAHFVQDRRPGPPSGPWASHAKVTQWDGRSGIIEHDGACDLIVAQTYYPGWTAVVNDRPSEVRPVDGGLQGVRLEGSGASHVELTFRPTGHVTALAVSIGSLIAAVIVLLIDTRRHCGQRRDACGSHPPE